MFMKNIHGGDIYKYENVTDFSANINPMGIPESVREAVVNSLEMCENYPQMFCDDLREKIGRDMELTVASLYAETELLMCCTDMYLP